MSKARLETAGWLGVASAALTIPLLLVQLGAQTHEMRLLREMAERHVPPEAISHRDSLAQQVRATLARGERHPFPGTGEPDV